jgi:tetratricopeptide (TPR) repeat protein
MIDRPILVLGTHRTDEQGRINDVRHSLLRLGMLSELSIGGLEPRSVLQIVRHLTGTRPGIEAFSGRLHQATGGNPFFLLETLRVLLEDGQLDQDLTALERVPLPDTVREAVETRLGRLDSKARQVLEAGAILGMSFDFDVVRHTAGRGEIETVDGLDQAVARQLLLEHPSGYHFRHALIRRTVEAGLGPVRRQLLHRRAARALEQVARGEAGSIARHFELGGEAERALEYYAQAAEEAEEIFAWREAEAHHGRVLALLNRLDPDRSKPKHLALRGEILVSRARIRHLQGCLEKRDADLAALSGLVASSDDDDLRLLTALHRVRYHNLGGRYAGAIATGEEGLALARRLGDTKAQSRLLAHIGFAHYFLGQPQAALVALESAIDVSGEQTDRDMCGRIFHILGYVHYHLGNYPQALDYHREAYACNRAPEHHNRLAWNLMDIGFLKLKLGRAAEARERLTESLALAREMAYRPAEAYALTLLGDWELYQGNYAAALDLFRESLGMQAEVGSKHGMVAAKDGAGFASYHLGDLDRAQAALRGALEHAREIGLQRHIALALVGLGLVDLSGDSLPGARDALTEALAVARESQSPENVALALAALARAERKAGNAGAALRRAREALRVAQTRPLPACRAWGHAEAGLALMARGEPREALEHTSQAVETLPRSHEAWVGAEEVRHAHARALQLLDRDAEARKQAQLARAAVEAKADRISDPNRRERYRQFATSRLG